MLGIKTLVDSYDYYSSKDEDAIISDIEKSLENAGISKEDSNYDRLFNEYKKEALKMKNSVGNMTRGEFFSSGYARLREEFGFGEKKELKSTSCKYDNATEEEEMKIREKKGVLSNALRDLKNYLTLKNRAGKITWGSLLVFGSSCALATGHLGAFALPACMGALASVTYFLGSVAKNIRRKSFSSNVMNNTADKIDDYWDEPTKKGKNNQGKERLSGDPDYAMSDDERDFMRRL